MSTTFQNRLVGTIIIAAVAIIFLPDLLDGDKQTYQEKFEPIPQAPKINFSPKNQGFPEEKLNKLVKDNISDEIALDDVETYGNAKQKTADNQNPTPLSDAVKVDTIGKDVVFNQNLASSNEGSKLPERAIAKQAWVIQLGSFRHQNNVNELVEKLKGKGYTVFTRPIKTKKGNLTKVFIGPELIKYSLEKKLPALKLLTNVQGKIARFNPNNR